MKLNHHHFTFFFNLGAFLLRFARTRLTQILKTELFFQNWLVKLRPLRYPSPDLRAKNQPGILMGRGAMRFIVAYLAAFFCLLTGFYPALEAKEAQTIKVSRISKKKYGDDPFVVTAKASSKLPVSIFVNGPASIDKKGKITIKGAGKVRVFAIQMGDDRYASAKPEIVTVDIAKSPLIVRAEDKKMKEGQKIPEFTIIYKGFVNGESVKDLTEPAVANLVKTDKWKHK
ncbi:MAG: MBG domain-containing protein, partial [Verrucomicrobiota bacterium]|nr:MBG domain-containing protein [Verrucomicrobiota bacterium]